MTTVKIKKIHSDAKIPDYAHPGDAGADLYSVEEKTLRPMKRAMISTGIKIALEKGYNAEIRPKSGLAANHGLTILNTPGTIDAGYRGEIKIIMINLSQEDFRIEKGMKIGQMVIKRVEEARFEEVEELDETSRNQGGFGSTGLKR